MIAEAAKQRQVGRHHGDLAELADGQRSRQLQRLGKFGTPKRRSRRSACTGGGKGL